MYYEIKMVPLPFLVYLVFDTLLVRFHTRKEFLTIFYPLKTIAQQERILCILRMCIIVTAVLFNRCNT